MWLMNRAKKLKEFFGIKTVFRYNISFIDPIFDEIFPSVMNISLGLTPLGNIITSGNISLNTPRSGSINNGNCTEWSAIWSEIKRVITKSHDREARV